MLSFQQVINIKYVIFGFKLLPYTVFKYFYGSGGIASQWNGRVKNEKITKLSRY